MTGKADLLDTTGLQYAAIKYIEDICKWPFRISLVTSYQQDSPNLAVFHRTRQELAQLRLRRQSPRSHMGHGTKSLLAQGLQPTQITHQLAFRQGRNKNTHRVGQKFLPGMNNFCAGFD